MGRIALAAVSVAVVLALLAPGVASTEPRLLRDVRFGEESDSALELRKLAEEVGLIVPGPDTSPDVIRRALDQDRGGEALCNLCTTFAGQSIQVLVQAALQESLNLCTDICSAALSSLGQLYPILCDVFACVFGEGDLISKVLDKVTPDLDPVLWCMAIDVCPRGHGNGKIDQVVVTPQEGPEGTTFDITALFKVSNSTGLEQLSFQISGGEIESGQSEILLNLEDGVEYSVQLSVQAVDDYQAQPPVQWLPGTYTVDIALCKGSCDDSKPWSGIQDTATTSFSISG